MNKKLLKIPASNLTINQALKIKLIVICSGVSKEYSVLNRVRRLEKSYSLINLGIRNKHIIITPAKESKITSNINVILDLQQSRFLGNFGGKNFDNSL